MAQFKESEHPRDSDGKFTEKGISKGSKLNTIGKHLKENISKYGVILQEIIKISVGQERIIF